MTTCKDKTREECIINKDNCTWCDGKTRKYCRKKKGKKKSKLKKEKTCKRKMRVSRTKLIIIKMFIN